MTRDRDLHVVTAPQLDQRLGRQVVHDPRSREYEFVPRMSTNPRDRQWRHRVYNPRPLPKQVVGCCTGVDQCVKGNALGNRVPGKVLDLECAVEIYRRASEIDPWPGRYPPTDTGSSGLAACKAAQEKGLIERYDWVFGAEQVLMALVERPVGVGTWWYNGMFDPDPTTALVTPTGGRAGGHQWTVIGWNPQLQAFEGLCWWGSQWGRNGLFRIRYDDFAELLADDGDAHVTYRVGAQ